MVCEAPTGSSCGDAELRAQSERGLVVIWRQLFASHEPTRAASATNQRRVMKTAERTIASAHDGRPPDSIGVGKAGKYILAGDM